MRRAIWPLLVIAASAGVVAALLGTGMWVGGSDPGDAVGRNVRGWMVPAIETEASPVERAPERGASTSTERSPITIPSEVRDVTPATVTPPPAVSGPLTRVAPPTPPTPPLEPWRQVVFHRPTILPDLSLSARASGRSGSGGAAVVIQLEGIAPLADDATCKDALGDQGPCGVVAQAALKALIGARAIECRSPRKAIPSPLVTVCRLGSRDLGAWLVERGYARATTSGAATASSPDAN